MRVTENADFFSVKTDSTADGQTDSHRFQKLACFFKRNIKASRKEFAMPRKDLTTVIITNQDAGSCMGRYRENCPLQKQRLQIFFRSCIKRSQIKPYYGRFWLCLTPKN